VKHHVKAQTTAPTSPSADWTRWWQSAPGQYVLAWEQARIDAMVADIFGYYAWQLGLSERDLLRENRIPFKGYLDAVAPSPDRRARWHGCVRAQAEALPFEANSVDLLVLPHVLETSLAPHHVLREAERVLVPEGRMVISGFNPWSLWGARALLPGLDPWLPPSLSQQVSVARLKDWFKLLSLEIDWGRFGCYAPPCQSAKWLKRWQFMEPAGERWWAVAGAVYVVSAIKRVTGLRLVGPSWKKRPRPRASGVAPAAASRHIHQQKS